jgi:hypothetical protein
MCDTFFRDCWLRLKAERPNLRKPMDEIEFMVAGQSYKLGKKAKRPDDELRPNIL